MRTHTFKLKDSEGVEHDYTLTLHPAEEGIALASQLAALVAEPLLAGLSDLLAGARGGSATFKDILSSEVDLGAMAGKAGPALRAVLPGMNARLLRSLVRYAVRVRPSVDPTQADDVFNLADERDFDRAFRGNYAELWRLCWEVVQANRFFPGLGGSKQSTEPPRGHAPRG